MHNSIGSHSINLKLVEKQDMSIPPVYESLEIDLFDETFEQKKESLKALAAIKGTENRSGPLEKLSYDLNARIQTTQDLRARMKIQHDASSLIVKDSFAVLKPVAEYNIKKSFGKTSAKVFGHVSSAVFKFSEKDPIDAGMSLIADNLIGLALPLNTLAKVGVNISGLIAEKKEDLLKAADAIPSQIGERRAHLGCDGPTPEGATVIGAACVNTAAVAGEVLCAVSKPLEGVCKFSINELGKHVCKIDGDD